ncbi:hypothetical protein Tco_1174605 [Tanacetum coccineum]
MQTANTSPGSTGCKSSNHGHFEVLVVRLFGQFQYGNSTTKHRMLTFSDRYSTIVENNKNTEKPSQNDKTDHGMEKTVQNQGQSPKMSKSESNTEELKQSNLEPDLKEYSLYAIFNPSDGARKAQQYN